MARQVQQLSVDCGQAGRHVGGDPGVPQQRWHTDALLHRRPQHLVDDVLALSRQLHIPVYGIIADLIICRSRGSIATDERTHT